MSERYVYISEVATDAVPNVLQGAGTDTIGCAPMQFASREYTNFKVNYSFTNGNFVVHFFVYPSFLDKYSEKSLENWWLVDFANSLSSIAQEHFMAGLPRIMAKYTPEAASWWFKAQGYDYLVDPLEFLHVFLCRLDNELPAVPLL